MSKKSCLVLAMVAGAACSATASDTVRDASARLRPAAPARHVSIDPATGEKSFGAPRTGSPLIWDAYSVTTGFYTIQEITANPGGFSTCGNMPGNCWVNGGDLPSGTVVDGVRLHYQAPGYADGTSQVNMIVAWWTQWSERRDTTDLTATAPVFAAGFILPSLPAGATYSWILTLDLKGSTLAFTMSGTDENGALDCDYNCPNDSVNDDPARDAMDWGWGLQWVNGPGGPGGCGPIITNAGPAGSGAPGVTDRFSPYNDYTGVEGLENCGFDYFFNCAPWADFSHGLFGDTGGGGCGSDCDGDGTCDEDEVDCDGNGTPDDCETLTDCNNNGLPDDCDPNHCPCDLTGNGSLNVFDFLEFQTLFGNGEICADFTGEGNLNVFDFLEFQTCFGNGC